MHKAPPALSPTFQFRRHTLLCPLLCPLTPYQAAKSYPDCHAVPHSRTFTFAISSVQNPDPSPSSPTPSTFRNQLVSRLNFPPSPHASRAPGPHTCVHTHIHTLHVTSGTPPLCPYNATCSHLPHHFILCTVKADLSHPCWTVSSLSGGTNSCAFLLPHHLTQCLAHGRCPLSSIHMH